MAVQCKSGIRINRRNEANLGESESVEENGQWARRSRKRRRIRRRTINNKNINYKHCKCLVCNERTQVLYLERTRKEPEPEPVEVL